MLSAISKNELGMENLFYQTIPFGTGGMGGKIGAVRIGWMCKLLVLFQMDCSANRGTGYS